MYHYNFWHIIYYAIILGVQVLHPFLYVAYSGVGGLNSEKHDFEIPKLSPPLLA